MRKTNSIIVVLILALWLSLASSSQESHGLALGGESVESAESQHDEEPSQSGSGDEEVKEKVPPYFYYDIPDHPIVEFPLYNRDKDNRWVNHEFLKDIDPEKHRIVEFYANWCPHCQHIRPMYIEFARKFKVAAKQFDANVEVYGVNCVFYKVVCHHYDVHAFPRIFLIKAGEDPSTRIRLHHNDLHPYHVLRTIGVELDADLEDEEDPIVVDTTAKGPGADHWLPRRQKDIFNDAYLSFQFVMKNGVFSGPGPLSDHTRDHFLEFLDILRAGLHPSSKLQRLVSDILDNAATALESEDALIALVDKYPPKKITWSHSCTRGNPSMGFTCGLWELFHMMTVGIVEYNQLVPSDDDNHYYRTGGVAMVLRNFIEHFFGCEECRNHFMESFDSCAFDGCHRLVSDPGELSDWIQLPMWLFEFHNGVNVRLMKEKAEREGRVPMPGDEVAVLWPPRKECPMCWDDDGSFEPRNILTFLRLTYWPEDAQSEILRNELKNSELNRRRQRAALLYMLKVAFFPVLFMVGFITFLFLRNRKKSDLESNKKIT